MARSSMKDAYTIVFSLAIVVLLFMSICVALALLVRIGEALIRW